MKMTVMFRGEEQEREVDYHERDEKGYPWQFPVMEEHESCHHTIDGKCIVIEVQSEHD